MQEIKTIKDLSKAVHEIRDAHAVNMVKLHNKYWKGVDPENERQVVEAYTELAPLLADELFKCLEEIVALVLKVLTKLYKIKNKNVLDIEDLMYQDDGYTTMDRLYKYYIVHKGQRAVYNLVRLVNTESEYVFSGVMEDKLSPDDYPYFKVDNLDDDECDDCPIGEIFPWTAEHPPFHPDCECFAEPLTQEQFEKENLN
jgi:hypothetical protein